MSVDEETVTGYLKTEWDCPECQEVMLIEGDASGETVECDGCGRLYRVEEVR